MPKKSTEMEKIILADGWVFKSQTGSHRHYIHPIKKVRLQYRFTVKTYLRAQKIPF